MVTNNNDILFSNIDSKELEKLDKELPNDELSLIEWNKLNSKDKISKFQELSELDKDKAYLSLNYEERIGTLSEDQEKLYSSLVEQITPGRELNFTKYARTSNFVYPMLLESSRIIFGPQFDGNSNMIAATRTTGGSSLVFYGYSSSGDKDKKGQFKAYKQSIEYYPDYIHKKGNTSNLLSYVTMENKKLYKPSLRSDRCRVTCSCSAYYYYLSEVNWNTGCKYGAQPLKYVSKSTTKKTDIKKNPKSLPGVCKHIKAFVDELKQRGYLID